MTHLPLQQLADMIQAAAGQVDVGALYRHYKGGEYLVVDLVIIEETDAVAVVYRSQTEPQTTFVRPLQSWLEMVDYNGQTVQRFVRAV